MAEHPLILTFLVFLGTAILAVPVFKKLGLGTVLGYLVAGSLLGPWGFGLISNVENIFHFSEFGVVLLLFVIGLELKPSRLWVMRRAIFGLGGAQVILTAAVFAAILHAFSYSWQASIVAGLGLSLSSTAFVLQILSESGQLTTAYGRAAFAILLFQDLATIPILAILPLLGPTVEKSNLSAFSLIKVIAVVGAISLGGRYLLRPIFRLVASARTREVFTGAALLVVLGTGVLVEMAGLSMALGTFLAGILLADSEYRHQIEADIEPFKGLLLGLFFMAVGMSVDYGLILKEPVTVLLIVLSFMTLKAIIIYTLARVARFSHLAALNMASVLPQGGEFAFVIFGTAVSTQALSSGLSARLIVAVTLSMGLTPLFVKLNEKFLAPRQLKQEPFDQVPDDEMPVIIAGFGRVGQIVGRILRVQEIGFTALEHDPEQVQQIRRFGGEIFYGDASRLDLLEAAGAKKAKLFILAIDNVESSLKTVRAVKEYFPHLKILARARNRQHYYELMELGVTQIIRETFVSSLELAEEVLRELGMDDRKAHETILKFRGHDERVLIEQQKLYKNEAELINYSKQAAQQLAKLFQSDKT